jgi:hypothetical protein
MCSDGFSLTKCMLCVVAVASIKLDKQQLLLDHCKCCRFTMGDIGTAQESDGASLT